MARKSFKGGLDNLFVGAGYKKTEEKETPKEKVEISEKEQHWLQIKNAHLEKELFYWRTGKLTPTIFEKNLSENGLKYDANSNEIQKK